MHPSPAELARRRAALEADERLAVIDHLAGLGADPWMLAAAGHLPMGDLRVLVVDTWRPALLARLATCAPPDESPSRTGH